MHMSTLTEKQNEKSVLHKRASMFDEKKDFIAEQLGKGAGIKDIWEQLGTSWYSYDALAAYIYKHFGKVTRKRMECERCTNLIYLTSPYKNRLMPACPIQKREFRKDFKDCPHMCDFMERIKGEKLEDC